MTYVVGWKSKSSVYLCADSIATIPGPKPSDNSWLYRESSIGEKLYDSESEHTLETLCKIENINEKIIIGFSGRVGVAHEIIDYFRRTLERHSEYSSHSIRNSFIDAIKESDSEENVHEVSFVFGFIDCGQPVLMSYNRGNNRELTEHTVVQIGLLSDSSTYRYITNKLSSEIISHPETVQLSTISAILQCYGFHERSIIEKYKVGGFILGAQLNTSGVNWNDDTIYILYSGGIKDFTARPMTLFVRENVVFISGAGIRKIIGDLPGKWSGIPSNELFDSLMPDQYKYIVFLSAVNRKITILKTDIFNFESEFANIKDPNSRHPTFYLTRNFFRHLISEDSFKSIGSGNLAIETSWFDDKRIAMPIDPHILTHFDYTNGGKGFAHFGGKQWLFSDFNSVVMEGGFAWFGEIQLLSTKTKEENFLYQAGRKHSGEFQFVISISSGRVLCQANITTELSILVEVGDFKKINPLDFFMLGCVLSIEKERMLLSVYGDSELLAFKEISIKETITVGFSREVIGGDIEGKRNATFNLKEQVVTLGLAHSKIKSLILYFENKYRKLFFYPKDTNQNALQQQL